MQQRHTIEKRIEDTMNSLDGIQRAAPRPFFYTRLKARLEQSEKGIWETLSSFITRPAMMFATVCIVLLLNAAVLYRNHISSAKALSAEQVDQTLNDAYDVASSANTTLYSIWNQDK